MDNQKSQPRRKAGRDRWKGKQAGNRPATQTDRQKGMHATRQADMQQTDRQSGCQTDRHEGRHTAR